MQGLLCIMLLLRSGVPDFPGQLLQLVQIGVGLHMKN